MAGPAINPMNELQERVQGRRRREEPFQGDDGPEEGGWDRVGYDTVFEEMDAQVERLHHGLDRLEKTMSHLLTMEEPRPTGGESDGLDEKFSPRSTLFNKMSRYPTSLREIEMRLDRIIGRVDY